MGITMALIYKINLHDLTLDTATPVVGYFELYGKVGITNCDQIFTSDLNILKYEYGCHDVYHDTCTDSTTCIHSHNDEEVRLFIHGNATLYIPDGHFLYIIECGPLDKIKIYPNVLHWFSKNNEILAYRFFKTRNSYTMDIPNDIPDNVIKAKDHFDKNGKLYLL
jgi:cupin superfamily acireductone dioxygenase involved in methionine salvage